MPVVSPGLALVAVHALLDDGPFAVVGDEKAMEIKVKSVLHGGAVDLSHEAAGSRELAGAVEAYALAEQPSIRRASGANVSAAAADMNAEFSLQRPKSAL